MERLTQDTAQTVDLKPKTEEDEEDVLAGSVVSSRALVMKCK